MSGRKKTQSVAQNGGGGFGPCLVDRPFSAKNAARARPLKGLAGRLPTP